MEKQEFNELLMQIENAELTRHEFCEIITAKVVKKKLKELNNELNIYYNEGIRTRHEFLKEKKDIASLEFLLDHYLKYSAYPT